MKFFRYLFLFVLLAFTHSAHANPFFISQAQTFATQQIAALQLHELQYGDSIEILNPLDCRQKNSLNIKNPYFQCDLRDLGSATEFLNLAWSNLQNQLIFRARGGYKDFHCPISGQFPKGSGTIITYFEKIIPQLQQLRHLEDQNNSPLYNAPLSYFTVHEYLFFKFEQRILVLHCRSPQHSQLPWGYSIADVISYFNGDVIFTSRPLENHENYLLAPHQIN